MIVAPEYNHGYPGILKHVLVTNPNGCIHKPYGLCGVSAGGFGGTRVVESLLPVMRELGMGTIFLNVSAAGRAFVENGQLLDQALLRRIDKTLGGLVWMARVLRHAPRAAARVFTARGAGHGRHRRGSACNHTRAQTALGRLCAPSAQRRPAPA